MDKKLFRQIGFSFVKIGLAVYFGLLISRASITNYSKSQEINKQKQEIKTLQEEIEYQKNLNSYYQTPAFLELEARKQLNMKADGERVIILPVEKDELNLSVASVKQEKKSEVTPNYIKWWNYFAK